jgi:uncharacterized protein (DUF934 family)
MRKILLLPEALAPTSTAVLADDSAGQWVSLAEFLADPPGQRARGPRVGVRVAPADSIEELAPHLAAIDLIGIEFPGPGDGRGFTSARLLRQRYGFKGELRAIGAGVKQDLLFFMVRCGLNAFDLAPTENPEEARRALHRFTLAYQPAVPRADISEPRFTAAH